MERKEVFVINENNGHFRYNQKAKIIGVEIVAPSLEHKPRVCYHLKWPDGLEDWVPLTGSRFNYEEGNVVV